MPDRPPSFRQSGSFTAFFLTPPFIFMARTVATMRIPAAFLFVAISTVAVCADDAAPNRSAGRNDAVWRLVVLNGNPAGNILATRNIALVLIRGRVIRPDSLRATWK